MCDSSPEKSNTLEPLIITDISNISDLKIKLNEIKNSGQNYQFDVSNCLKTLLISDDTEIQSLTVQALSELVKCNNKRETYAQSDYILPLLRNLERDLTADSIDIIKNSCRSLGNLCYNCDEARNIILENKGITSVINLLKRTKTNDTYTDITGFVCKLLLNYTIGGQKYSEDVVEGGLIDVIHELLVSELEKVDMNDDLVETTLTILINNENTGDLLYNDDINEAVLNVLKQTTNFEISSLCLDLLSAQAENDSVKTLVAKLGGVQMLCERLEDLLSKYDECDVSDDSEVDSVIRSACDLIILVLTGDEAMHMLYGNGAGDVYQTMVKWLESTNYELLVTALLAIGNFARQDDYCIQLMEDQIFDKILDIFEVYHRLSVETKKEEGANPISPAVLTKIEHASLAALRNLSIPAENKRVAAEKGRAAPMLLDALLDIENHHVAYKLMATIRMLMDGQESVAQCVGEREAALRAIAAWAHRAQHAGVAGEAPRLLARTVVSLRHHPLRRRLVRADGCVASLVAMLVATHSLMQAEAIVALTLLHAEAHDDPELDAQLAAAELGKHVSILVETNLSKMPLEVAQNLLVYLRFSAESRQLALEYRNANVRASLQKFKDARSDLGEQLQRSLEESIAFLSEHEKVDELKESVSRVEI